MKSKAGFQTLTGIIGFPLEHTLSPQMHQAGFREKHLPFVYLPLEFPPKKLHQAIKGLQAVGARGVNVTVPYKEKVLPFLTQKEPAVQAIGAANTLVFDENKIYGYNTDVFGFLKTVSPFVSRRKKLSVLLLGAGGAARAVLYALSRWQLKQVILVNRNLRKARKLKESFSWLPAKSFICAPLKDLPSNKWLAECNLLVQTTPVGMFPQTEEALPFPFENLASNCLVVDLIYRPNQTLFLKRAHSRGYKTQNGLPMLFWQGVRSFELFTGKKAPREAMAQAIRLKL